MFSRLSRYATQQLKEFDGKKLKSTTKEGLDIDDEDRGHSTVSRVHFSICKTNMQHTHDKDEKKKIEELKAEFEPLTKLMKEVLGIKWICVFKRCGWSQPALILLYVDAC